MIAIQEVDEYTTTVPVANNAEYCSHQERLATAQALANRTHRMNLTLQGGGNSIETIHDVDVTPSESVGIITPKADYAFLLWGTFRDLFSRVVGNTKRVAQMRSLSPGLGPAPSTIRFPVRFVSESGIGWVYDNGANASEAPCVLQSSTSAENLKIQLPPIAPGLTITAVSVSLGSTVSHSGLPATMPQLSLYASGIAAIDPGPPVSFIVGAAQVDTSANLSAYEFLHSITVSGLSHTVGSNAWFFLSLRGEGGTNSQANALKVYSASVTFAAAPDI